MLVLLSLFAHTAHAAQPPPVTVCDTDCMFTDLQDAINSKPAFIALGPGPWQGPFTVSTVIGFTPLNPSEPPVLTCNSTGENTVRLLPITSDTPDAPALTTFARFRMEACPGGRALALSGNTSNADLATEAWLLDSILTGGSDPDFGPADGGLIYVSANARLRLENSVLEQRTATANGGHIYVDDDAILSVIGSTFEEGRSPQGGSIYGHWGSRVAVSGSTFSYNEAISSGQGGAIALQAPAQLYIGDSVFDHNEAYDGGALSLFSTLQPIEALVQRSRFSANTAINGGAWILAGTEITVADTEFADNEVTWQGGGSGVGGAIYANNTNLHVRGSRFNDNSARQGGAIRSSGGQNGGLVEVSDSTFYSNRADRDGGGPGGAIDIYNFPGTWDLMVVGSTLRENVSSGGGAIHTKNANFTAVWSHFAENNAKFGGAWTGEDNPSADVHHNVFCQNVAYNGTGGAGYLGGTSTVELHHNLVTGNVASIGAGGFHVIGGGDVYVGNNHFIQSGAGEQSSPRDGAGALLSDSYGSAPNNLFQGGVGNEGMNSVDEGYVLGGPTLLWHPPYDTSFSVAARSMDGTVVSRYDPDPVGIWESGSCNTELWSKEGNAVYLAGTSPDNASDPWPIGAFHNTIFVNGDVDIDGDGSPASEDCDDRNPQVFPGATELPCDGVDQDCEDPCTTGGLTCAEGELRDGAVAWFRDHDDDGVGDPDTLLLACAHPGAMPATLNSQDQWYVNVGGDCNDNDADVSDEQLYWPDSDGDGSGSPIDQDGVPLEGAPSCTPLQGYASNNLDCDDSNGNVGPHADEVCDDIDNDCNGSVDLEPDSGGVALLRDDDSDGYAADDADGLVGCPTLVGFTLASNTGDCDDTDDGRAPNLDEICDGVDQNCNGIADADEAIDRLTYFVDGDEDGYGTTDTAVARCVPKSNEVLLDNDCDDATMSVHPNADEVCNQRDDDCDTFEDEDAVDRVDGHADEDGDGHGAFEPGLFCGYETFVANNTDCDDNRPEAFTGADEVCNLLDDDCDELIDEDPVDGTTYYADLDSDGFGAPDQPMEACAGPGQHTENSDDCNDNDGGIHPDAFEDCSPVDRNCDGNATESAVNSQMWFEDSDGDGYGDPASYESACEAPSGFVDAPSDCNDRDADVYPGAPGYDADCARVVQGVVLISGGGCSTPGPGAPGWLVMLAVLLPLRRRVSA